MHIRVTSSSGLIVLDAIQYSEPPLADRPPLGATLSACTPELSNSPKPRASRRSAWPTRSWLSARVGTRESFIRCSCAGSLGPVLLSPGCGRNCAVTNAKHACPRSGSTAHLENTRTSARWVPSSVEIVLGGPMSLLADGHVRDGPSGRPDALSPFRRVLPQRRQKTPRFLWHVPKPR